MKYLSTRDLRNRPGYVRELSEEQDLVLTANGKPVAILVSVEDDSGSSSGPGSRSLPRH